MKTWLVVGAVVLVAIPVVIYLVGASLPVAHVASGERRVGQPPAQVARLVREVEAQTRWRADVTGIEVLAHAPVLRYRETTRHGAIEFELHELARDSKFESRIVDRTLPFGGKWTIELTPGEGGTLVRIREDGEVYSPLFRFFARYAFGHDKTLNAYLDALMRAPPPMSP